MNYDFKFYDNGKSHLVNENGTIYLADLRLGVEGILYYKVLSKEKEYDLEEIADSALKFIKKDCAKSGLDAPYTCFYQVQKNFNTCSKSGMPEEMLRYYLQPLEGCSRLCADCTDLQNAK